MAAARVPRFDSGKESKRFIRNLVWVVIVCALFLIGQGLRYNYNRAQLARIHDETDKLYVSVLGEDIGNSPFGRLQFEHGKLSATLRIGLDPLSVLAALSRPAGENLRLEGVSVDGMRGRAHGFYGPNIKGFDRYLDALSDDDLYLFSLEKREDVFGGITFSLIVEPR
jgi:hypothetical protein